MLPSLSLDVTLIIAGYILADHNQHVDNQLFLDHAAPDCTSEQLYKGIVDDQARGFFQAKY
jgi:Fe-S cluster assembly protein SufD